MEEQRAWGLSDIFAFYASHSPMTDPGEASALIDPLPHDVAAVSRVVQGLGDL